MKLINIELTNIQYIFSDEKNNQFTITMYNGYKTYYESSGNELVEKIVPFEKEDLTIKIITGSPSFDMLIGEIQNTLDSQRNSFSLLKFNIDVISGKMYFRFKTLNETSEWNRRYIYNNNNLSSEQLIPNDGKQLTKTFGMPYLSDHYDYLRYVYLGKDEVDRLNQDGNNYTNIGERPELLKLNGDPNPTNTDMSNIDLSIDIDGTYFRLIYQYKMLEYEIDFNPLQQEINKSFAWQLGYRKSPKTKKINYYDTFSRFDTIFNGYIEADSPYGNNEDTYNYIYVDDFVGNYTQSYSASLKNNYLAKSILGRIQIDVDFFENIFSKSGSSSSSSLLKYNTTESNNYENQRNYYGPVDIQKLHIKILDSEGKSDIFEYIKFVITLEFEECYNRIY